MAVLSDWKIFLELVLLWYIVYMILLFVKGTRSEQLLKGLLILGIIFVVTQQLGLDAINWAIARLFPLSVITLVIIFQPELRRGLAQLGQFGIRQENLEIADEVVNAAMVLSHKKMGALIVIEKEVGLKSYVDSGTAIDAKVTSDLIISIFIPLTPLHDGAVIIQQGRLVAAGCILPLPEEDKTVPKNFGMRHRAAIGLSEETDAVCVVVSEETSAISIASGGKLSHDLDKENFAKILKNMLRKQSVGNKLKGKA